MCATQMVSKLAQVNLHNLFAFSHDFILNRVVRIIDSPKSTIYRVCAPPPGRSAVVPWRHNLRSNAQFVRF